jgi:pilus assembly protein CpaD
MEKQMSEYRSALAPEMRRNGARLFAITMLGLTLGGCYYNKSETTAAITPNDYRLRHPIAIREGERTVEILLGTNRGGLTPAQRADVLAFAQAWRKESTGGIIVDAPTGTANEAAGVDAVREIRSIFAASGVPAYGVNVRPYQPADKFALASIKLNYSKMTAEAGPCGLWPHDLGPSFDPFYVENKNYWNHGCSTQRNLAAMVENPADLVQPRGESPSSTGRRQVVYDKYRKGEAFATSYPDTDKAKISDVGK